jgi:hypothetical protein
MDRADQRGAVTRRGTTQCQCSTSHYQNIEIASDGWLTKFWEASSAMVLSPANDRLRGADITLENPMLRRNQNVHKALD